jgi:CHASE2 domain-containing sensor protein
VRVGAALAIAFLLTRVPMEYLEAWTYDLRVKTKALTPPSGKLVLIAIDPLTIEGLKRDPNAMDHVRLLNALSMSRPRAVVYVQSPNDLDGSSEDLKAFAQAAKNLDHFFVVANQIPMRGQEDHLRLEPPLQSLRVIPGPKTSDLTSFAKDDVTRRMIVSYHGLPTVHALLADSIYGKDDEEKGAINHFRGLFEFFGTDQNYIDFRPSGTYKPLSFIKILQGAYSPDQFHDKIIFVGTDTVMSSSDYIRTPFSRDVVAMSTLEMHANMTDTLIKNSAPQKTSVWLDSLLTGLISVLTVFVVLTARPAKGLLILVTTFSLFSLVCYLAFNFFGYWVAMAHPMLTLFVCYYFWISCTREYWSITIDHTLIIHKITILY